MVMKTEKQFAEELAKDLKEHMAAKYADAECIVVENRKNNGLILTGITFEIPGREISPVIYTEAYYEAEMNGITRHEIIESLAKKVEDALKVEKLPTDFCLTNYDSIKEYLLLKLVNTEANRSMLKSLPHLEMEDLSVVPVICFSLPGTDGKGTVHVTSELTEIWGVALEEVLRNAMENMERKGTPVLQDVMEILRLSENVKNWLESNDEDIRSPEGNMFALTFEKSSYGAAIVACPNIMQKICDLFPNGFYIIPSSIHEVLILLKENALPPIELRKIVRDVNRTQVEKDEILSDCVYTYDREKQKICRITEPLTCHTV